MANADNRAGNVAGSLKGWSTEHAAAVIVISALVLLILIRKGFRGVSVMGASIKAG